MTEAGHRLHDRLAALLRALSAHGRLHIAFSGGLDSRFLSHAAQRAGLNPLLLHVSGPHIAPAESVWARQWAHDRGLSLAELKIDPLAHPAVAANAEDRCYHCKHALFSAMLRSMEPGGILCDGSNLSDQGVYRPGLRALNELGIRSPLAEAELSKDHIRELGRLTGLDRPDQCARPCLLTRFAYGLHPTRDLLARLAEAEESVAALLIPATDAADTVASPWDLAPDFRLRLPRADRLELHSAIDIDLALQARIADAVAAHGLPRPEFVRMDTISGYYDALRHQS